MTDLMYLVIWRDKFIEAHWRLGVEVDRSTKCHPELAGEGIEYSWGRAKSVYRRAMLVDKKGKENFQSTEKEDGKGVDGTNMDAIETIINEVVEENSEKENMLINDSETDVKKEISDKEK